MQNVVNYLNKIIKANDIVVVATSGGPDSMALLDLVCNLKQENLKIICAHVNHKTRKECDEEQQLVKKYCDEKNIIFENMKIEKQITGNFEMEARKIRYQFFEKIINKYKASYLFTAHHGDDLIETILMRLNRGSILKGYKGIDIITKKEKYTIVRPLLLVTKKELLDYVEKNNILYAMDSSNNKDDHTRNRFRHYVLPFLKEENENVHLKYKAFSEELKEYDDFVEKYIDENCKKVYLNFKIDIAGIKKEETLIQRKIVEKYLNDIYDGYLEVVNKNHVNQILELITKNVANTKIDLPNNLIGIIDYKYFKIIQKIEKEEYNMILNKDIKISGMQFKFIDKSDEKSNYILRLNAKELNLPLHIRNRKDGDKIEVKNLSGTKKVSDILTNEKINYTLRQNMPIITDNNGIILWIPGIKKSKFDKEKSEKYDIIIKYISNKEENNE